MRRKVGICVRPLQYSLLLLAPYDVKTSNGMEFDTRVEHRDLEGIKLSG